MTNVLLEIIVVLLMVVAICAERTVTQIIAIRRLLCEEAKTSSGDSLTRIVDEAYAQQMPGDLSKPNSDFEVNGPPRRKPWVVRKRELEEAARTKRKRLESFSEYV